MTIETIYSFLTYPKRSRPEDPLAPGTEIPVDGENKLVEMLGSLFQRASDDCVDPIRFRVDHGNQVNPVRDELLALLATPSVESAAPLALRLQRSTSGTSGMGLMFICIGADTGGTRLLVSRFPADEGVVAERSPTQLTVQFVEQVFLKSAHSYKAATFVATGRADQLWQGHIVDRQLNHGSKAVADYWIVDFLIADFSTTRAAGTKRLAVALRQAASSTDNVTVKQEIASAAQLAANIPQDRAMTIVGFCDRFNFSSETKQAVVNAIRPSRLINDRFRFDAAEFNRHLAYKQVELDNGAILTAPADRFSEVFVKTRQRQQDTFSTTGLVVDERLRKSK
jgi:hypothetical protein